MSNSGSGEGFSLTRPFGMSDRSRTQTTVSPNGAGPSLVRVEDASPSSGRGRERQRDGSGDPAPPVRCINPASDINSRLDTQVEVRVYPCNNSQGGGKKKFTTFTIKPEVSLYFYHGYFPSSTTMPWAYRERVEKLKTSFHLFISGSHYSRIQPK